MCPPPIDPILPLGPVAGGIYVDRADSLSRVMRRRPREEEQEDGQRGHSQRDTHDEGSNGPRWMGSRTPAADAGTYDDHGRHPDAEASEPPGMTHVDRIA